MVKVPAMRVAFNATPLLTSSAGIANYIRYLGRALVATGEVDSYSFYRYRWRHEGPTRSEAVAGGSRGGGLLGQILPWVPMRGAARRVARHLGFDRGLRRYGIDLYHEQNYVPLSYDVPVVVTVHDLSWIHYPDAHPSDRVQWLERGVPRAMERAAAVLVDSEFVRREVLATFGLDAERVHTALLGASGDFAPRSAGETARSLGPLGLVHGSYLLTVGTIEPRKNLRRMLEAYDLLPSALRERFPLAIAGERGWHSRDMVARLRRATGNQVRFLGHVESEVLRDLYAGAALFTYPSLYEGFGLPPLEAMASGVPVVVSDRASLPEVVGDAGVKVDPEDVEVIAAEVRALLEDEPRRRELASSSLARARQFSWKSCAEATLRVYRGVLGQPAPRASLAPS